MKVKITQNQIAVFFPLRNNMKTFKEHLKTIQEGYKEPLTKEEQAAIDQGIQNKIKTSKEEIENTKNANKLKEEAKLVKEALAVSKKLGLDNKEELLEIKKKNDSGKLLTNSELETLMDTIHN